MSLLPCFSFVQKFSRIRTLDMHTGGEPLRIVMEGFPDFEGKSVLEVRRELKEKHDHLRKAIMWEPRGHADMYGLLKIPAQRPDSAFGVIFMHNEGYSTMCGHATIAIGKAAIKLGWVASTPPLTRFAIDAPCGQLKVYVHHDERGEVLFTSFENVPSFYVGSYELNLPDFGSIRYDLAYGGAFYAYLDINQLQLSCSPEHYADIIRAGKAIKKAVIKQNSQIHHPYEEDLSFLYGTIFIDKAQKATNHSANVCVFAEGEVDRCSTGSGVSGRAAIHFARKELKKEESMVIESILGSELSVKVIGSQTYGKHQAVIPLVSGNAFFTGSHEFWIDPEDPLKEGFFLR